MTERPTQDLAIPVPQRELTDVPSPESALNAPMGSPPAQWITSDAGEPELGPMSPLTDPDFESDSEPPTTKSKAPARNTSMRKRKASDDGTKPSPKRQKKQSQTNTPMGHAKRPRVPELPTPAQLQNWKWNLTTLISRQYIFVRLNDNGKPADGMSASEYQSYWWPAKIIATPSLGDIEIQLYGDDGKGRRKHRVKAGEANTKPYHPRPFNKFNFATPPTIAASMALWWGNACKALDKDENGVRPRDDFDDLVPPAPLPQPLPSLAPASPVAATTPAKKHTKPLRPQSPSPVDPAITLGSERVLTRLRGKYWPSVVIDYKPSTHVNKPGTYLVEVFTLAGGPICVQRSYFYLRHEEGFKTCKLADYPSSGIQDDDSDSEEKPMRLRSPSLAPELPALPLPEDDGVTFRSLTMSSQVALIAPVLDRILHDTYAPAKDRNSNFVKGGKKRQHLGRSAGIRGPLTNEEMNELRERVFDWTLGDERTARRIDDDGELRYLDGYPLGAVDESAAAAAVDSRSARETDSQLAHAPLASSPNPARSPAASSPAAVDAPSPTPGDSSNYRAPYPCDTDTADSSALPRRSTDASPWSDNVYGTAPAASVTATDEDTVMIDASTEDYSLSPLEPMEVTGRPQATSSLISTPVAQEASVGHYSTVSTNPACAPPPADGQPSHDTVGVPTDASGSDTVALECSSSSIPPSSLFATSPIPSQPDIAGPSSPASSADEVSPSSTLLTADASPRDTKACLQRGSLDSQSYAETRVDRPSSPAAIVRRPRRVGSAAYERLSRSERNQYCLDVLIHEAVVQILLWRRGKKTTTQQVLSDEDEIALHTECLAYAEEEWSRQARWMWVDEIRVMRRVEAEKEEERKRAQQALNGRPMRSVPKRTYVE